MFITQTSCWCTTETSLGVSFETFLRRREDVVMGRRCYVLWRRCYHVPIKRCGDVPLRRLGDVSLRRRWVFHLRSTCDVAGAYRETSLRRRHDVLFPGGKKKTRCDTARIPPNLRYIDRKKVRTAKVMIKIIVSLTITKTITETNSVLRAAGNFAAEMVSYTTKEMKGNMQLNWWKRIVEKQKALRKELGQFNRMRLRELQNEGVIWKLEKKIQCKTETFESDSQ